MNRTWKPSALVLFKQSIDISACFEIHWKMPVEIFAAKLWNPEESRKTQSWYLWYSVILSLTFSS